MNRSISLLFVLILLGGFYLYQQQNKQKQIMINNLHEEGKNLFAKHKYKDAIEKWSEELEFSEKSPYTWNNIGMAYTYLKDYEKAITYHKTALEISPNLGNALYSLGRAVHFQEKYKEAQEYYIKAINAGYERADVYYSLATTYKLLDECEKAVDPYLKTIKKTSSYPWANYFLGKCYETLGKADDARAAYKREGKSNSENATASEIAIIEMGIKAAPDNVSIETYFELGKKYRDLMHIDDMNKSLDAFYNVLLRNDSYPSLHYELGQIYQRMGGESSSLPNFDHAIREYNIELKNNPSHKESKMALSQLKFMMENFYGLKDLKRQEKKPFQHTQYKRSDLKALKQQMENNSLEILKKENSHEVKIYNEKLIITSKIPNYPKPVDEEKAGFLNYWVYKSKTGPDHHRFYSHELSIEDSGNKTTFFFNGLMIPYFKREINLEETVELYISLGCYDEENNHVYLIVDEFNKEGKKHRLHRQAKL